MKPNEAELREAIKLAHQYMFPYMLTSDPIPTEQLVKARAVLQSYLDEPPKVDGVRPCPWCLNPMREVLPLRQDLRDKGVTFVAHVEDYGDGKQACWLKAYMPTPQEWNRRAGSSA